MTADRFLPLIEQMYAREWLLERALEATRNYVRILESEPGEATEEEVEAAARILNLADTELREGPVRV